MCIYYYDLCEQQLSFISISHQQFLIRWLQKYGLWHCNLRLKEGIFATYQPSCIILVNSTFIIAFFYINVFNVMFIISSCKGQRCMSMILNCITCMGSVSKQFVSLLSIMCLFSFTSYFTQYLYYFQNTSQFIQNVPDVSVFSL